MSKARVPVTVEVVEDEHPAVRATREAPPDERPYSDAERIGVEAARQNGQYVSTEELRARLAANDAATSIGLRDVSTETARACIFSNMSGPNTARAPSLDPVATAVAAAPEDERPATEEEIAALREARADKRPLVPGSSVTSEIADRSRREE